MQQFKPQNFIQHMYRADMVLYAGVLLWVMQTLHSWKTNFCAHVQGVVFLWLETACLSSDSPPKTSPSFFILCFLFCLFVCLFCFSAHFESNYLWHLFFYHHSNCDFVSFYKKNLRKLKKKKKHDVKRSLGWFCNRNKVGFSDFYLCGDLWICVEIWRYPL